MSAAKAFEMDAQKARRGARKAAGMADRGTRMRAYVALCEELGEAANRYAFPCAVACALVHEAAAAYAAAFKERVRV